MKVGIIIPYRNDRPRFFKNLMRMIAAQTLQPEITIIVDYAPINDFKDITPRYRTGYEILKNKGLDVIALMEVDDWYAPDYLEIMAREWEKAERPDVFGQTYTIYYHIKVFGYFKMNHIDPPRSSAMNTFIKPDLNLTWPPDNDPYTDVYLWELANVNRILPPGQKLRGAIFTPDKHICLGIKHGEGKLGGGSHVNGLDRYTFTRGGTEDKDMDFLKKNMDKESFVFYSNYFN